MQKMIESKLNTFLFFIPSINFYINNKKINWHE